MFKRLSAVAFLLLWPVFALAQSQPPSPGGAWTYDFKPTVAQWQAAWAAKADYGGSPPCLTAGCVLSGKLTLAPSTTAGAGLNCGAGTAPTSPVNGDLWCTTSGVFARINGSTVTLAGGGGVATVPNGGTGQSSFTANLPIIGNGASSLGQGTLSGTTTKFGTVTGSPTTGHCVSWNNGDLADAGGACTTGGGGGTVSAGTINQLAYYSATGSAVAGLATCASGYIGTDASSVPSCRTTLLAALQAGITQVGTLTSGNWNASVIPAQYGGTGFNNGSNTINLAQPFAIAGAGSLTLNTIGGTSITLPTSGNIPNANGTSGGIPYYNTTTTLTSSAALGANLPLFGGGAGSAPFAGTRSGSTTEVATVTGSLTSGNGLKADASGNVVDFGSVPASLSVQDQTLSGGANVTVNALGTVTSGTTTLDCGKSPLQTMTNNGASTVASPSNDGSCILLITNGASAGALTFTPGTSAGQWKVSSNTGDAFTTTNASLFMVSIVRAGGTSTYIVKALQ